MSGQYVGNIYEERSSSNAMYRFFQHIFLRTIEGDTQHVPENWAWMQLANDKRFWCNLEDNCLKLISL